MKPRKQYRLSWHWPFLRIIRLPMLPPADAKTYGNAYASALNQYAAGLADDLTAKL